MSFKDNLKSSAKSSKSAYLQYVTGRDREGFAAYAFVEDDDDIAFYQYVLLGVTDICYVGCGGKTNVVDLYRKMESDGYSPGNLFMVDRDSEDEPFEFANEILRTAGYSWENHICERDHVRMFIQTRFDPSPSGPEADALADLWANSVQARFCEIICKQFALMRAAIRHHMTSGASDLILPLNAALSGDELVPSEAVLEQLVAIELAMTVAGVPAELIAEGETIAAARGPLMAGRGKSVFHIFRKFIERTLDRTGSTCRTGHSSPALVLYAIRPDSGSFDYVRTYAQSRLAA